MTCLLNKQFNQIVIINLIIKVFWQLIGGGLGEGILLIDQNQ
jgi:hypothetical protein